MGLVALQEGAVPMKRSDVVVSKTSGEHRSVRVKKTGERVGDLMRTGWNSVTGWDAIALDGEEAYFGHQADAIKWLIRKWES